MSWCEKNSLNFKTPVLDMLARLQVSLTSNCALNIVYFAGVVRTAYPMDRETQDQCFVVIQARVGEAGVPTATTTVTINLSDVNDNPPRFQQSE